MPGARPYIGGFRSRVAAVIVAGGDGAMGAGGGACAGASAGAGAGATAGAGAGAGFLRKFARVPCCIEASAATVAAVSKRIGEGSRSSLVLETADCASQNFATAALRSLIISPTWPPVSRCAWPTTSAASGGRRGSSSCVDGRDEEHTETSHDDAERRDAGTVAIRVHLSNVDHCINRKTRHRRSVHQPFC